MSVSERPLVGTGAKQWCIGCIDHDKTIRVAINTVMHNLQEWGILSALRKCLKLHEINLVLKENESMSTQTDGYSNINASVGISSPRRKNKKMLGKLRLVVIFHEGQFYHCWRITFEYISLILLFMAFNKTIRIHQRTRSETSMWDYRCFYFSYYQY